MSTVAASMFPGFRFCPSDEELISYYLRKKLDGHQDSVQIISDVDLYNEWFFFSPGGRKYPNGSQSKRATECGYWNATGKERNVKSSSNVIGTKRTSVFHLGRAPKGERTEWLMHEYCINDKSHQDPLVVCRIKKNPKFRVNNDDSNRASSIQMHAGNSLDGSNSAVTEAGADQRDACEHDKGVGCSSKRSNIIFYSSSVEQIDSASESNHRPASGATLTESFGQEKGVDDEDCYAEILKDDIIKLDEFSLTQDTVMGSQDPLHMLPCHGTALRRIRLRRSS